MKQYLFLFFLFAGISFIYAEDGPRGNNATSKNYSFNDEIVLPATSVKDQYSTSTCWSFSTLSLFESELLRQGKPELNLSEMFVVWHTYLQKAIKQVRLQGAIKIGPGGAFHDVTNVVSEFGIVPECVYSGLSTGRKKHMHDELDRVMKSEVENIISSNTLKNGNEWIQTLKNKLNTYLGELPETFEYENKTYTPQTFAGEYLGLNMGDYVEITSYTHHPFYHKFILEVPDNWSWDELYNVPVNEMQEIIDYSVKNGFSVAWAADITEKGFQTNKKGLAVLPASDDLISEDEEESETGEKEEKLRLNRIIPELTVCQEKRQHDFDAQETTDDHGMHIIGIGLNQDGSEFYKVKNSWGDYNRYKGYFYASKPYVAMKTMSIMVHKDGIPKPIREKLGL